MTPGQATVAPPEPTGEWDALRARLRHRFTQVIDLVSILLQDAVILVVGFLAEFAYEHWLHSEHPFFQLAISLSSAFFLLLYGVTVTVHVAHYVREQMGPAENGLGRRAPWLLISAVIVAASVLLMLRGPNPVDGNSRRVVRTVVLTTGATQLTVNGANREIDITPDGGAVVYSGPNRAALFTRALDHEPYRDPRRAVSVSHATLACSS